MPLKTAKTESAQPPAAMVDETEAAPASHAEPTPGAAFDTADEQDVATTTGGSVAHAVDPSSKFQGVEDKVGYGSFPQIKLDKDKFIINDDEVDGFDFEPISSRPRWIHKANKETFVFSYDNHTATNGQLLSAVYADWKAAGYPSPEKREYQEVLGIIKSGDHTDEMVILSVPPASVPRLAGVMARLRVTEGLTLDQVILRIEKGAKITTKAKDTFYPWKFTSLGKKEDYVPE